MDNTKEGESELLNVQLSRDDAEIISRCAWQYLYGSSLSLAETELRVGWQYREMKQALERLLTQLPSKQYPP